MYSKTDYIDRTNELIEYCLDHGKNRAMLMDLMNPLLTATNTFFALDINSAIDSLIEGEYHDYLQAHMIYNDDLTTNSSSGTAPEGYDDLTTIFSFISVLDVDDETFCNSITTVSILVEEVEVTSYHSDLVDAYMSALSSITTSLVDNITALDEWCRAMSKGNKMINLLEDRQIVTCPTKHEIVKKIYLDRKVLEVIQVWQLNTYIPSIIGGANQNDKEINAN